MFFTERNHFSETPHTVARVMARARADKDDARPGTIPWDEDHVARAIEVRRAIDTRPKRVARRMGTE